MKKKSKETTERFCRKHYFLVDLEERRKTPCPICGCMITFQELKKKQNKIQLRESKVGYCGLSGVQCVKRAKAQAPANQG